MRKKLLTAAAAVLCGCASTSGDEAPRPTPIEGVQKVIESLSVEIWQRLGSEPFRGRGVVVVPASNAGTEPIVSELLRTRLVERGVAVDAVCAAKCMEVTLREFSIDGPHDSALAPGKLLQVASGSIPVVGGIVRNMGERETEKRRAAARSTGYIVTFAARDDNRYVARANLVAITSSGDVAIEKR
jgi:hypothetical protein